MYRLAVLLPFMMAATPSFAQNTTAAPTAAPVVAPDAQAKLDKIARKCGLKKGTFTIRADGLVDTHEPLNSTVDKMNCAHEAMDQADFHPPATEDGSPAKAK